jgi:1-acyl-sn-glycerol-3-phosphate acyltransferase
VKKPAGSRRYNAGMLSSILKLVRLAGHILAGVLIVLLRFPSLDRPARALRVTRWAAQLLAILAVRVRVRGEAPPPVGALVAANHISWLDIHVLHSLLRVRFISKAEVRDWPIFGLFAEASGTVFLVREKRSDAMRVNQLMAQHLREGDCLALFPEGTTSDGRGLLPFFPSLFQPAVEAGTPVWPVCIRYLNTDGTPCSEAAYYGHMSLGESLRKILKLKAVHVEVAFLPPIASQGLARRDLARAAEEAIRATFSAVPGNAPGSTARLPA